MSNFSQIYTSSQFMSKLLEGVPEAERGTVLEHLKSFMSQYDHLAAGGWEKSSIAEALRGPAGEMAAHEGRRPPRRG